MKDYEKLKECDRRARELAGLYAAEKKRADSLAEELRSFAKIREHYEHAKQKHLYFCDGLLPTDTDKGWSKGEVLQKIVLELRLARERISERRSR